jgi:hypothetical protein
MHVEKATLRALREVAGKWLHGVPCEPDDPLALEAEKALEDTNIPVHQGRPRRTPEQESRVIQLLERSERAGKRLAFYEVAAKVGMSHPTVAKIWREHCRQKEGAS